MADSNLTVDRLREVLDYNPSTGIFYHKRIFKGISLVRAAGTTNTHGYRRIVVDRKNHAAHRLAWLYETGKWPENDIDHINGVKDDNRIENLREATRTENAQNLRSHHKDSMYSKILGVAWCKKSNRWLAKISIDKKSINLGAFKTAELAGIAYKEAKIRLHPFGSI